MILSTRRRFDSLSEFFTETGIQQKFVAEKLGISQSHLSRLIKGDVNPSPEVAAQIERMMGIPFKQLFKATREND